MCSIVPVIKVFFNLELFFLIGFPLSLDIKKKKSFKIFARACLPGSDILPVSLQEVSGEVTLSLGLCLFTFAIASLVGPLAVSFIKRNNNKSKQIIVNVPLHRLALFMTLMVLTLPDSLRLEHLGSLVPLFYPLLRLPSHRRVTRRK